MRGVGTISDGLLLVAVVTLVPFVLLAAWARLTPAAAWEIATVTGLRAPTGGFGDAIGLANSLGDPGPWALIVLALAATLAVTGHGWAAALVGLTLLADFAGSVVKFLVERDRPPEVLVEHFLAGESFAFPSGHVVRAVALVGVVAWLFAPAAWRLPALLAAGTLAGLLMGYARIALGVHWPSDVLGGLLLGLGWAAGSLWLLRDRVAVRRTN